MATPPPLPPRELAAYVLGGVDGEDWADAFDAMGRRLKRELLGVLPGGLPAGSRVLDFGCGSGRLLRQLLDEAATCEIHGCDIDAPSIGWVRQHLCPPLQAELAPGRPPLPYADGCFDVVLAASVLSQLADGWEAWLLELRRILAPGGHLVLTLMGPSCAPAIAGRELTDAEIGMSVHGFGRPWAAGGPMILHGEWWVRAHYGRAFEVVDVRPGGGGGQDLYVLRRPADSVPVPTLGALAAPEPGEPRELSAARHDVNRLHADYARLNASHDAYAAAYAAEAERVAELRAALA
ncbi:MAG: hypothetical protein JWM31_237, partial [Solirubrobacterales bacterium]|nr:hypothetical protein [Solirubrobacterales bacterium]